MSDNIKLVIEMPKDYYEIIKHEVEHHLTDYRPFEIIAKGTPLDENKGEWIPVTKRLPEPEDKQEVKVIVSYENEDGEFVEKGVFNKRYGFNFPSVKAWQPLPDPYKEESKGDEE